MVMVKGSNKIYFRISDTGMNNFTILAIAEDCQPWLEFNLVYLLTNQLHILD